MVDARLPGGERVNVIVPPLSLTGPIVTIRRFPKPYRLEELIEMGSLDPAMGLFLSACVRARCNIVVSGGTGSGKTTLLNALSGFIPNGERIITIEDAAELQLLQEHVVRLEARPPNVEGKGEITIRDLVRNSLRMRPERIIVGEVRGGETLDMLQAMNTGHEGSLVTVHANTADDAVMRIETLASMSELHIPFDAIRDQINSAVDVIVHLARSVDGTRRIVEVATVASRRRETFRLATLAEFHPEPLGPDRVVRGQFEHFPLPRPLAERLVLAGEAVPAAFGVATEAGEVHEREAK
jgi:pilus assembly protein CpaF